MTEEYIRNEYDKIKKNHLLSYIGCSAGPEKRNIFKWNVLLKGPNKTCYENGLFKLSMEFPSNYPNEPPSINFVTKIYHPNISLNNGAICISSKSTEWDSHRNLVNIIYSIFDLLKEPNIEHGINNEALSLYKNNKEEFERRAKEYTKENSLIF